MPEYVATITKTIRYTVEVTMHAEDDDAAWGRIEDASGEEVEKMVKAGGRAWRKEDEEYEIEDVSEA